MIWKIRDRQLHLDRPLLMGILNLTPDSFSDGGHFVQPEKAVVHALGLVEDGADILDLGAESTRPGALPVAAEIELSRLTPVVKALRQKTQIPISIDTTKPEVARACLELGADIINDISGLKESGKEMAKLVRSFGAGLVIMHRRGNPETMQALSQYKDVVADIMAELKESIDLALAAGIRENEIVIDPGLGFAKTHEQNFEILNRVEEFSSMGYPVLLGPSRKSFLGRSTGKGIEDREFATAACIAYGAMKKVSIFRVHEVRSMRDVLSVMRDIQGEANVRTF